MDSLGVSGIELRPAAAEDADLIRRILTIDSAWHDPNPSIDLAGINTAYHEDWGGPDDFGVVAFVGIEFVGGAYARRVGPANGTAGYVDPEHSEVTMGIEVAHRGHGFGHLALEVLKAKAIERGIAGLSLSVEIDNAAARALYTSARFSIVEERATDVLMEWRNPTRNISR
jgi:ribosomal protein S18 acetylase RimI-like enzyme